jgi:hypothetical protein
MSNEKTIVMSHQEEMNLTPSAIYPFSCMRQKLVTQAHLDRASFHLRPDESTTSPAFHSLASLSDAQRINMDAILQDDTDCVFRCRRSRVSAAPNDPGIRWMEVVYDCLFGGL